VNLVIHVKGGKAWIKVWVDGKIDDKVGLAGKVYGSGKTLSLHGQIHRGADGILGSDSLHPQRDLAWFAGADRCS
jgi:hypothetical protein